MANGLVLFERGGEGVKIHTSHNGWKTGHKIIEFTGSQDSDARVKQAEHVTALCIDCFHVLTHPRDH